MSFSVAFYFTCSPRALSASATSASSPTEGALLCCHGASPLSTRLLRKTNRKPQPLQRTRCGAVPSAADRWLLSNDSQRHNSNSVLHRCWPRLHEISHPHTALSARFRASRRSVSPSPLDTFYMPQRRIASSATSPLPMRVGSSPMDLHDPDNFYKSLSLRSICIRPASAAPAASF